MECDEGSSGQITALLIETALIDGEIAFRQHSQGHIDAPNWPALLKFAERYIKGPKASGATPRQ